MKKYSHSRSKRIADQIHKDVVQILKFKVKDPRVNWVTINDVEVTDDNTWATIYWTVLPDEKRIDASKALESAKGFIRSELSHGFRTYTIPQLKFVYDESIERGAKILKILDEVKQDFTEDEVEE
ncbi:MAG: ribosome-binding factor [Pseudomonadota bacterium]|nr:ribosome-binding factor [Pseudomonadota bacterium]